MMKTNSLFIASLLLLAFCMSVKAQDVDTTKHPGYINLEDIEIPESAEEVTDIDLGPALLAFAKMGRDKEGKDLEKGLKGILSIRVKSFDIGYRDVKKIRPIMDKIEKKLERDDWVLLVRTKSRDELANISMKVVDGKVVGFLLMSIDSGSEVSFVNIFGGNIDLESIKDIGMGLSDSALDSLKMNWDWD
jgi:hypothetical protein